MNSYGNTGVGGRSIFSSGRKVRSNAGMKRGPRKPLVLPPNAVIMANAGGVVHVMNAPKYRGSGRTYGPMFVGPLRPKNVRRARATRSNAGGTRTRSEGTKANIIRKRQKYAKQLGLKRVPGKGYLRNKINAAVRNGRLTL